MFEYEIPKEKLATLVDIITKINSTLELDKLLIKIADSSKSVIESENALIMLIDKASNELFWNTQTNKKNKKSDEIRYSIGQGVEGIVAETGKPLLINNTKNDERIVNNKLFYGTEIIKNILCVPLKVKNNIIGVLEVINAGKSEGFNKDDLNLLNVFSEFAAISISNRELFHSTKLQLNQLSAIYQLSQLVNQTDNEQKLINKTIDIITNNLKSERISIILKDKNHNSFRFLASKNINKKVLNSAKITVHNNILSYVQNKKEGIYCKNIDDDPRFGYNKKLRYNTKSFICVPLINKNEIEGFISITEKNPDTGFGYSDFTFLNTISREFYDGYLHILLNKELTEKSKIETEVEVIAKFQKDLLPREFNNIKKASISAISIPCKKVGGDFYDIVQKGKDNLSGYIGDVSGKGLPAAVFMSTCRSLLKVNLNQQDSLKNTLQVSNNYIFNDSKSGLFTTAFMFDVNTKTKKITYTNAGHFEQYLFRPKSKKFITLHTKGKPLGIFENEKYAEASCKFQTGDMLVLFTDGVIEAANNKNKEYSEIKLKKIISDNSNLTPDNLKNKIISDVKKFTGSHDLADDLTLLILKF